MREPVSPKIGAGNPVRDRSCRAAVWDGKCAGATGDEVPGKARASKHPEPEDLLARKERRAPRLSL